MTLDLSMIGGKVNGKPLRSFITRRKESETLGVRYFNSSMCPVIQEGSMSQEIEAWPYPGDELFRDLCAFSVERLIGRRLEPLQSIKGRWVFIEDEP